MRDYYYAIHEDGDRLEKYPSMARAADAAYREWGEDQWTIGACPGKLLNPDLVIWLKLRARERWEANAHAIGAW